MTFPVYDHREDLRNLLVTPQIRARFCLAEAHSGGHDAYHTHDLGHEIFIVMSGRLEFRIGDGTREVGPGQMCVALAGQPHSVRVVGDEPAYFFLAVTPHIQPTHTFYDDADQRQPPLFRPSCDYDVTDDPADEGTVSELLARHMKASRDTAEAANNSLRVQEEAAGALEAAVAAGDMAEASRLREQMWSSLLDTFSKVGTLATTWNALAPRAGDSHAFY